MDATDVASPSPEAGEQEVKVDEEHERRPQQVEVEIHEQLDIQTSESSTAEIQEGSKETNV